MKPLGFSMFTPPAVVGPRLKRRANAVPFQTICKDMTMPPRDWKKFDALAKGRYVSERKPKENEPHEFDLSNVAFLRRQAE